MSIIISYPLITDVANEDLLVISDVSKEGNPTRSVSVGQLAGFIDGGGGDITLTTLGTSGEATLIGTALNIPVYTGGGGGVDSVTTTNGSFTTVSSAPTTGDVVVTADLSAVDGTAAEGIRFLSKENKWAVPGSGSPAVDSIIGISPIQVSSPTGIVTVSINTASSVSTGALTSVDWNTFNNKQDAITLSWNGTSGPATFNPVTSILNIPVYSNGAKATASSLGTVKLNSDTVQPASANIVSDAPNRTYGVQFNGADQMVVNVPWTGTSAVTATASALGIVKLNSDLVQSQSAVALSSTANRTYGVQFNASEQMVVNVPWVAGGGTVTDVTYTTDIAAFTAAYQSVGTTEALTLNINGGSVGQFLRQDGLWATPPGSGGVTSITPVATTGTGTAITTIGDITFTGANGITTSVNASNVVTITGGAGSSLWTANGSDIYFTSGNVGIGFTAAPSASLEVSGRISQIGVNASTLIGFNAGLSQNNVTNNYSTAIGYEALTSNSSGLYNTALGFQSLKSNTTGNNNTAIGFQALKLNIGGYGNVAIGYDSLGKNTSGYQNSSIGWRALWKNDTGYQNVAIGYGAMTLNTSGSQNNAIGINALTFNTIGASNTALGNLSLHDNTDGNFNVGVGVQALGKNTTGSNNVSLGYQAGFYITGGNPNFNIISDNSVFVGNNSQAAASGQTNQIVIGNDALGNGSNTVTIGSISIIRTHLQGTVTTEGRMDAAFFKPDGYTFATLPSPPAVGAITYITDAGNIVWRGDAEASPTPGIDTVAQVFFDGTNWIYS